MSGSPPEPDDAKPRQAEWSRAPERSNMLALRAICAIAILFGRPLTRLILHPISVYFLLFSPTQRRHAASIGSLLVGAPGFGFNRANTAVAASRPASP